MTGHFSHVSRSSSPWSPAHLYGVYKMSVDTEAGQGRGKCASCIFACSVCRIICYRVSVGNWSVRPTKATALDHYQQWCCLIYNTTQVCQRMCSSCVQPPPPPKQVFSVLCLGLEGSGKTTLLSGLAGEPANSHTSPPPTMGFAIKAVATAKAVLEVKELGGAAGIRPYWERYFRGQDALVGGTPRLPDICTVYGAGQL